MQDRKTVGTVDASSWSGSDSRHRRSGILQVGGNSNVTRIVFVVYGGSLWFIVVHCGGLLRESRQDLALKLSVLVGRSPARMQFYFPDGSGGRIPMTRLLVTVCSGDKGLQLWV